MLQDASALRKGKLKVGAGIALAIPLDDETYFTPDGPGVVGPADKDLQYVPLAHPFGWTRYGLGHDLEFTTAFHVPTFAVDLGLKWSYLNYEPGDVVSAALAVDVGGGLAFPSLIVGVTALASFHVTEQVAIDLSTRFGTMSALWDAPNLTSTLGVSIGRKSTLRFALGYTAGLGDLGISGLEPAVSSLYLAGGWEY